MIVNQDNTKTPIITLRLTPELHNAAKAAAWHKHLSLNAWLLDVLRDALLHQAARPASEEE
jgi:predicted HicB family RNase H-like nuclease